MPAIAATALVAGEGYPVLDLDTGDPWEALGVAEAHPIRLLLTDVMTARDGRLRARQGASRPSMSACAPGYSTRKPTSSSSRSPSMP